LSEHASRQGAGSTKRIYTVCITQVHQFNVGVLQEQDVWGSGRQ
jgi:hypothetical protein